MQNWFCVELFTCQEFFFPCQAFMASKNLVCFWFFLQTMLTLIPVNPCTSMDSQECQN